MHHTMLAENDRQILLIGQQYICGFFTNYFLQVRCIHNTLQRYGWHFLFGILIVQHDHEEKKPWTLPPQPRKPTISSPYRRKAAICHPPTRTVTYSAKEFTLNNHPAPCQGGRLFATQSFGFFEMPFTSPVVLVYNSGYLSSSDETGFCSTRCQSTVRVTRDRCLYIQDLD